MQAQTTKQIAALFVEESGCYFGIAGVDPWGVSRDARLYDGPYPVVAHPPCARWSVLWSGGFVGKRKEFGDDNGCFKSALETVRTYGGVIEHPARTKAYKHFGIRLPEKRGWAMADTHGGWVCQVDQRHYGHRAHKQTWLYCCKVSLPQLKWGKGPATDYILNQREQYKNARHDLPLIPTMKAVKDIAAREGGIRLRTKEISATPPEFRDLLISIARSAYDVQPEQAPRTLFAMPEPVPLKQPFGLTVDLEINVDSS